MKIFQLSPFSIGQRLTSLLKMVPLQPLCQLQNRKPLKWEVLFSPIIYLILNNENIYFVEIERNFKVTLNA